MQRRRCTHTPPMRRQSSQPVLDGVTSLTESRWVQESAIPGVWHARPTRILTGCSHSPRAPLSRRRDARSMGFLCTPRIRRSRRGVWLVAAAIVVSLLGAGLAVPASAGSSSGLVSIGAGLKGRDGLAAAVTAEGLSNVSALAFDDDGRMWTLTAGYED